MPRPASAISLIAQPAFARSLPVAGLAHEGLGDLVVRAEAGGLSGSDLSDLALLLH